MAERGRFTGARRFPYPVRGEPVEPRFSHENAATDIWYVSPRAWFDRLTTNGSGKDG
jgi:hypothetical protein